MQTRAELREALRRLEGKGYGAYKGVMGRYVFDGYQVWIDHVQGDPFAEPSRVRAVVPAATALLPPGLLTTPVRRTAVADFLNRALNAAFADAPRGEGSGRSGELTVLRPGQEVLRRTSLLVHEDGTVEARFRAGLPAAGRRILGREAATLLCDRVPRAVEAALLFPSLDADALRRHVFTVEDARALRDQLAEHRMVAFVADGSLLPRRSGVDDRPLPAERVVPFHAPDSLRVTLHAPNAGPLPGLGVPAGVTLLVGGGFHGKSTLLRAIERGVYDHIPGDGRERAVTLGSAVKVRAEDGRSIVGTDIAGFIGPLPGGGDTRAFHTENASGSTSQAAAIAEALEVGTRCLLLDEDTSATNFLIRDARVQALIRSEHEPITPLIDRARELFDRHGVSLVLVVGGSGDYFDVADTVIAMRTYLPLDVTTEAREVAARLPTARRAEGTPWTPPRERVPLPGSLDPSRGRRAVDVRAAEPERARFGEENLDLSAVEQLVEAAQTRAIGRALAWGRGRWIDGQRPLRTALEGITRTLDAEGLDVIDERIVGDYAEFRIHELAAALNRLRSLRVGSPV